MSEVTITVRGAVGSGKSALCGEIENLCKAHGLEVNWVGGQEEKNYSFEDWRAQLEMYKPKVTIHEKVAHQNGYEFGPDEGLLKSVMDDPRMAGIAPGAVKLALEVLGEKNVAIRQIRASRYVSDWTDVSWNDDLESYSEQERRVVFLNPVMPAEPTEEMIQAACLWQCHIKYASYAEWKDQHTSGAVEKIRKLLVDDYKAMVSAFKP